MVTALRKEEKKSNYRQIKFEVLATVSQIWYQGPKKC